jgi:nucleoid-associated protein YgaU
MLIYSQMSQDERHSRLDYTGDSEFSANFRERTKRWSPERKRKFMGRTVPAIIILAGVALATEHFVNNNPQENHPSVLQQWYNDADYALTGAEFSPQLVEYTVHQGDTLWSIANNVQGVEDVFKDQVVAHIRAINNIQDLSALQPGSTILIPARTGQNLDFSDHEVN